MDISVSDFKKTHKTTQQRIYVNQCTEKSRKNLTV